MKTIKFEQLQYIILIVIALLLIGVGKFISAGFSWDIFTEDPTTWVSLFYSTSASLFIIFGGLKWKLYKDGPLPEIIQNEKIIKGFAGSADRGVDFNDFLDEENMDRKARAWRKKLGRKRLKIQNKNLTKRRRKKIERIDQRLTNDYINDNIRYIKVRYKVIKPSTILTNVRHVKDDEDGLISPTAYYLANLSPKFIISIGGLLFARSFTVTYQNLSTSTVLNLLFDLAILLINFAWGTEFAKRFTEEVTLTNLNFRTDVIKRYHTWKESRKHGGSERLNTKTE